MVETCVGVGTSHSLHEKLEKVSQVSKLFSGKIASCGNLGSRLWWCGKQTPQILTMCSFPESYKMYLGKPSYLTSNSSLSCALCVLHSAPIILQDLQKHWFYLHNTLLAPDFSVRWCVDIQEASGAWSHLICTLLPELLSEPISLNISVSAVQCPVSSCWCEVIL